ncbi:tetratricopeptide repeat protein [bacterium]|nr:tetratricopeptide repeat protein [bacterium]MBU1984917.1 tetratricopeptide repeat protein [bacterium]
MRRRILPLLLLAVMGLALLTAGCAYYNTFYNAKRKFAEAERDNRNQPQPAQTQQPSPPRTPANPQGAGVQRDVRSPEKYRKVLETCAKLLELYPKSRWVDDALYLMGVSYYRLGELGRADRKFTELTTLFPKSKHIPSAILFRARTLAEQTNRDQAIELLVNGLPKAKRDTDLAALHYQLGVLYRDQKRWDDAAEQFNAAYQLRPPRAEAMNAMYHYGLCRFSQRRYEEARDAFVRVTQQTTDWEQAYNAFVYWARAEMRIQNYEQAGTILRKLSANPRFLSHADDIPLELADLTLQSGRIDESIALYTDYVRRHPTGEQRALAHFRMAMVYRDHLANLPEAKAHLDSTIKSGAAAEIADSARAALALISKGLLAIERISEIRAELEAPPSGDSTSADSTQPEAPVEPTGEIPTEQDEVRTLDSVQTGESLHFGEPDLPADSALAGEPRSTTTAVPDSIQPARAASDSTETDSTEESSELGEEVGLPPSVGQPSPPIPLSEDRRETLLRELQLAYLHVAEFYQYNLIEPDSAMHYYRLAADFPFDSRVRWKANLYLASYCAEQDSGISERARQYYQAVVDDDSVSADAANVARQALGLPLIVIPVSPQVEALQAAEYARFQSEAPLDSVLKLYSAVIATDSTSTAGQTALFAKAHIYEEEFARFDSARVIYTRLLALFPDSSFAERLRRKLGPPDSVSCFLLTDAQLLGSRAPVEDLLEEEPDETGWPPSEESLRGRRFH